MSFVNGIKRNLYCLQELNVFFLGQRLWSYIEQFGLSRPDIAFDQLNRCLVERRIQVVGHTITLAQTVDDIHLILHQGYQRRDNDGSTVHDEGRQLIAEALSPACRHQYKRIVAIHQIADDCLLVTLERIEAEMMFQLLRQIHLFCHTYLVLFI